VHTTGFNSDGIDVGENSSRNKVYSNNATAEGRSSFGVNLNTEPGNDDNVFTNNSGSTPLLTDSTGVPKMLGSTPVMLVLIIIGLGACVYFYLKRKKKDLTAKP
jgi:hypothetical protein